MSPRRNTELPPETYESRAHFRHRGEDKRPGDTVALSAAEAAELEALGFVMRPYSRRDMNAKG